MRNLIMMATVEEINENGIKFTMADLARRLAVSKSTIYMHFTSKEEIISAVVDYFSDIIRQDDEAVMNDEQLDWHAKFKALFLNESKNAKVISNRFLLDLKRYMPKKWKETEETREHKWQMIETLLKEGMDKEIIRTVDFTVFKIIYHASIEEFLSSNFLMQNNLTVMDAVNKMVDIFYYGLASNQN